MNKLLLLTFLVLPFVGFSQSTNGKINGLIVSYDLKYKKFVNDEKTNIENTMLIIDAKNNAIFTFEKMINLDSIQRIRKLDIDDIGKIKLPSSLYFIFQKNKSIIYHGVIGNDLLKYSENPNLNWVLMDEEKRISDLKCKKASVKYGGRNWVAWYTTDIPVNAGPYKFNGLPGLILEITDSESNFSFEVNQIENGEIDINEDIKNYFIIDEDKTFREIKKEDFYIVRSKFYQMNLNERIKYMNRNNEGIYNLEISSETGDKISTNRRTKERNFIERYDGKK